MPIMSENPCADGHPETERGINTLLINLDDIPLGEVLARRDSALAQAVLRERGLRSGSNDDDHLVIAGFNNFV